jgi:hypothetical protein
MMYLPRTKTNNPHTNIPLFPCAFTPNLRTCAHPTRAYDVMIKPPIMLTYVLCRLQILSKRQNPRKRSTKAMRSPKAKTVSGQSPKQEIAKTARVDTIVVSTTRATNPQNLNLPTNPKENDRPTRKETPKQGGASSTPRARAKKVKLANTFTSAATRPRDSRRSVNWRNPLLQLPSKVPTKSRQKPLTSHLPSKIPAKSRQKPLTFQLPSKVPAKSHPSQHPDRCTTHAQRTTNKLQCIHKERQVSFPTISVASFP